MKDYKIAQKIIHWVMALLIIIDLNVAQKFGNEMTIADRLESRSDHATIGTLVFLLLIIRIEMRFRSGTPPLPSSMSAFQASMAKWGHFAIYLSMFCLVITGLITASQATDHIVILGSVDISFMNNLDNAQFLFVRQFHNTMTWVMITLIVIHVLAAFYHHFRLKDDSLRRMSRFWD